jgi:phosphoglucosamine mutase
MTEGKTMGIRFGTDGLRGRAGVAPIDDTVAWRLGRVLSKAGTTVVVARDTRPSGQGLAGAVLSGVRAGSGRAVDLGVLPTPGLSALLALGWGQRGVMVTASHNPPGDNGLKVLAADGRKLDDAAQEEIEARLDNWPPGEEAGLMAAAENTNAGAFHAYVAAVQKALPRGAFLPGPRVVVDAARGAASATLPALFEQAGAIVTRTACDGLGEGINVDCGALYPEALRTRVLADHADAGVAVDGDGDRCILVTASGRILDGDAILFLLATPPAVVGTIMANSGLDEALSRRGIKLLRTPVGDRHVEAERRKRALRVGGEPSGHICFSDGLPTADGALAALRVLAGGIDLDRRIAPYVSYPSLLLSVKVRDCRPLEEIPALAQAEQAVRADLGACSRTVIRFSGTEPVLRILVEGRDEGKVEAASAFLAHIAKQELGKAE